MQLSTYLFFDGNAEQALTFYTQALGAEVLHKIRFGEAPVDDSQCATTPPFPADKIMHASLKIGDSLLMLSDGKEKKHGGFSVSLHSNDLAQGKTWFERLSVGANVTMPFQETFWALGFGMLTDRFGIPWMVNVEKEMG
ncbi:VOC family metalloprotein YjdN [Hafnia paralvei]|uniref:VOC family metalloprotein YjdN n=1 Tax=Hafnia paralvei TaxID=546367 RepID=UPI0018F0E944|nr:VOC family metalloprotein YjdN [Hafnia paralvei]MBW2958767.1 VOC family metalloprotein YjdN [Hafnia paralvei]MCQ4169670.1 VOC family metalloprotein YjdN [Hafnia paralvei]